VMVNLDGHRNWQFHDYERTARLSGQPLEKNSERPQYHRRGANPDEWIANLKAEKVDLLFCTNLEPIAMRFMRHTPDGFPIEVAWMRARPRVFRKLLSLRGNPAAAPGGPPEDTYAVEIYAFSP